MSEIGAHREASSRPVLLTGAFWMDLFERAIRTAAQVALATFVTDFIPGADVDIKAGLLIVGYATLASVLTSLAALGTGEKVVPNASFFLASGKRVG